MFEMFKKFKEKPAGNDMSQEAYAKAETVSEVSEKGTFTDETGAEKSLSEHPEFGKVVEKVHELDRLYNVVSETKQKLMREKFYDKLSEYLVMFGVVEAVAATAFSGHIEGFSKDNNQAFSAALVGIISALTSIGMNLYRTKMYQKTPTTDANVAHEKALKDRIDFTFQNTESQNK